MISQGPLKTPLPFQSTKAARKRLAQLEARHDELKAMGEQLVQEFQRNFPNSPAYLTRYTDRTLNDYRWRRSSARKWRGDRPPGINVSFDLTGDAGIDLLTCLPPATRKAWLEYERRRIELNLALSLLNYERYRLNDYLTRMEKLRALARK